MKKILISLAALAVLAAAAFLVYQNRPEKRYARHVIKARLFTEERNFTAALKEYEAAYATRGGFTPYSSAEVLRLTNALNIQKGEAGEALANSRKFTERYPTNKEGRLILADIAFRMGDVETALEALTGLLAMDPKNIQARMIMASLRARQQRFDLAEEEIRIIHEEHPDSLGFLLPLAKTLLDQGKAAESRNLLRTVLASRPKDTAAYLMLTDSYLRQGNADSARAILDEWGDRDPAVRQQAALREARLLSLLGKEDSAMSLLAAHGALVKENTPTLLEIAKMRVKRRQFDSAAALYQTLKDLKFQAAGQNDLLVALVHFANHKPARALETLKMMRVAARNANLRIFELAALTALNQPHKVEELMAGTPDSLRPALREFSAQIEPGEEFIGGWALMNYYQAAGEPAWAFRTADSLHRRWPGNSMIARLQARQLAQVGRFKQAAGIMEKLARPELGDRMLRLDFLVQAREQGPAMAAAEALLRDNPGLKGVNVILADLHRARGNRAKSLEHYHRELAVDTANLIALNNLAWEYGAVDRDFAKAEPFLARLKAGKNADPRILDTIGWILALGGRHAEAVRYFDLALALLPDNPTLLYHKGWLELERGRKAEGRALLEKAAASRWPFAESAEVRKLLAGSAK